MSKISITRALAELKLLESRIQGAIAGGLYVANTKGEGDSKKVVGLSLTPVEVEARVKSSFDTVESLINRRDQIKALVIASNATTKVKVNDVEMTVAEAIERKNSITYKEQFLHRLRVSYTQVESDFSHLTSQMEAAIDTKTSQMFGADKSKVKAEDLELIRRNATEQLNPGRIDPKGLASYIENLVKDIDGFKSEVDFVLSESNARTEIEIQD